MSANIGANTSHNSMTTHRECPPMPMSSHMSRSQELNYVEALKTHQMTRLCHIQNEATKLRLYLETLQKEVQILETRRRRNPNEDSEWPQKVSKLREDNRALRIECHCLSMEVDLYASGQVPLGVTDENFYRNVPPGPNGPLIRVANPLPPQTSSQFQIVRAHNPPYPVQPMPRPALPPSYEESIYYPPPRFIPNTSSSSDILRQVPPPPRPVWLPAVSPSVQQTLRSVSPLAVHTNLTPPQLPPRPNSASPRTPLPGPSRPPLPQSVTNQIPEEGQRWTCEKCTVENHPAMAYCELCEMPRNGYLGICLNPTNNYYANPIQNLETVATHVSAAECYCHNCRQ